MAQYQHLPIYKTTYELLQAVTRATAGFPKAFKYSLGDKIRSEVVDLVVLIFKANSSRDQRARHTMEFLERLQVVQLLMRLCRDMHLLGTKLFSEIVGLTDSLGRQASGWAKATATLLAEPR